ncbi:MAG: response regulator [bacterium]|nr:response regulator [bacterium]
MATKSTKKAAATATGGKAVLIIEDDEFLAKMMARMLEEAGLRCTLAGNGKEGLRKAQADVPQLIILDIILPDLDGFSILSKLKAAAATKAVPVIIISNLGQEEDVQQGLRLGAKDYIVKSDLSLDAVVAKVMKQLK